MSTSKVVIVEYRCQDAFKVPKGMDLEDKTQVTEWYVKWNILHIELVDGTELEINSEWDAQDDFSDCMKHPIDEPTIEDAKDYGFDEEEEVDCTDDNRCEECTYCARTKPCECGCGFLGGTCEEQSQKYEAEWSAKK